MADEKKEKESAPHTQIGELVDVSSKVGVRFAKLSPEEINRLLVLLLVIFIAGILVFQMFKENGEHQSQFSFAIRSYEAEAERSRQFFSSERDKDRLERDKERAFYDRAEERWRTYFREESEKNRIVVTAATQELEKWRKAFADLKGINGP